jgi:hypothetical protein
MSDDETAYRGDVIPADCANGHVSYPAAFRLQDRAIATLRSAVHLGRCPECGAAREIRAGMYQAGPDGVRQVIQVDGTAYLVTRGADGLLRATDGSNQFAGSTLEALRMSMSGMAGNPRVTGSTFTTRYNPPAS